MSGKTHVIRTIDDGEGFAPSLILFPSTTPTLVADVMAMATLKARYAAPMFCFGPHASTTPAESMARAPQVNGMFVGEPEDGAPELAALADTNELGYVASLTYRLGGEIIPHRAHGTFNGFLEAPVPAWDLLDVSQYTLPLEGRPYVIVETSRGCPCTCDFCVTPIHQRHKFRERSASSIVDEMAHIVRTHGVRFFYL